MCIPTGNTFEYLYGIRAGFPKKKQMQNNRLWSIPCVLHSVVETPSNCRTRHGSPLRLARQQGSLLRVWPREKGTCPGLPTAMLLWVHGGMNQRRDTRWREPATGHTVTWASVGTHGDVSQRQDTRWCCRQVGQDLSVCVTQESCWLRTRTFFNKTYSVQITECLHIRYSYT